MCYSRKKHYICVELLKLLQMETEKNVKKQTSNFIKERFSFELTVNDNIICQRYFRIHGFKQQSLYSEELCETLKYCAELIKKDLKDKTQMFNWYTAPQVFKNTDEMWKWFEDRPFEIEPLRYIILEESEEVYLWDGEKIEIYEKYFNRNDYVQNKNTPQNPCVLKLTFLDNDKPVCSTSWDGNIYPRFIRTNIDLSNSKNKYKQEGMFSPMECAMVNMLNAEHEDLIPIIVKEFCICCSGDENTLYTTRVEYGDKEYSLSIYEEYYDKVNELRKKLRKKTDKYFENILN